VNSYLQRSDPRFVSVGGVVFAVQSFRRRRRVFCGSILSEACLLWFGPLGASSLRFDPFAGLSFAVRSVGGILFAVQSFRRRRLCGLILSEACLLRYDH
jgi:hypothetical protein